MANIRSANEIIQSLIDFYRLAQPDLDTKPGTVARDLFIEGPASYTSILYNEISNIANKQSYRLVVGSDLDKVAKNHGLTRKQSTPSKGVGLLTFSSINAPIAINKGDTIIAKNGISFSVVSGISITTSNSNLYKSIASKFRAQLDANNISDEFAVQISLIANSPGTSGNIGPYSLSRTNITGVSNVININIFSSGTDQESDAAFRTRLLSSFSGSSIGTSLGYLNLALGTTGVSDAYVISPGDVLMERDGTEVSTATDGSKTIISEGSGGKVDIAVLGDSLVESIDSYIYRDKSNSNDPTNSKNNIILGQIVGDENKTINKKRIDNIKTGVLPSQPVNSVVEVTGSLSGSNFIPKSVDVYGRVSGNYELVKDTGAYAGSPWGFDKFKWISDRISDFNEDKIKGQLNGQDPLSFTGVKSISNIQQNISITNENSIVTNDKSIIQLLHTPCSNVTRVFNANTGERYFVSNQNLDNTESVNKTGRIKITGNTLPSQSDQLQVDYNWVVNYDSYSDYDGLVNTKNGRSVVDSVDWGYSSTVNEIISFSRDSSDGFFSGTASHPISSVLFAKTFLEINASVVKITSGLFVNRYSIAVNNLSTISSVDNVLLKNSNSELYLTAENNGSFSTTTSVVGLQTLYNVSIILPTDTSAKDGDFVSVILNSKDVYYSSNSNGSINNNTTITIPTELLVTDADNIFLKVAYIANISDIFSSSTTTLPLSRSGNGLLLNNNNGYLNFSQVNLLKKENQTIQKNTSNQIYIDLSLLYSDYSLNISQIKSVIRLSDKIELWNSDNPGSIIVSNNGNYQLILSGYNSPAVGEQILVLYYSNELKRHQPFSYSNSVINSKIKTLSVDPGTNKLYVSLNEFTNQSTVTFQIIEPNTDIALFDVTDGYLISNGDNASLSSYVNNFATLPDLLNKHVKITNSVDSGIYDITSYDTSANTITISNIYENISKDQVCIIRISDSKEVWNYDGVIDIENNKLLLPSSAVANFNDKVYVLLYKFNVLKKSGTKIISSVTDQVTNSGVITLSGTTIFKSENIIFTCTGTSLKINISEAVRKTLNLNSATSIPSNIKLAKIAKLEKVITVGANNDEVVSVVSELQVNNSYLQNNLLYVDEFLQDSSLQNLEIKLPSTTVNNINLPTIGDKLRITFYYMINDDFENLSYTKNGVLYTNKKFAFVNKAYISSGFKTSQSAKLTASMFTQPGLGSRYKVYYDYLAPKPNERISIKYNYNRLVTDVTFNVEKSRPINSDVLIKQSKQILVDLTMNIVIATGSESSANTILQNVRDQLISNMTTTKLGDIVDTVTLINIAQSISGVARARILFFNKTGGIGQVLQVQAQNDEYINPNNIVLNIETR